MQQRRLLAVVIGPLAAGVLMAGCGGSDNSSSTATSAPAKAKSTATKAASGSSSGSGSTLALSADPSGALKFNKKVLNSKSGAVTVNMTNPSSVPHAIAVEGNGVDKDGQTVTSGGTSTVSVTLKPGKYTFYCPVDSHKQQGMQGTLTVT
ncbi:MAG TPA: plastocyanin/azurin family copper-binding protein [Solirubrobacteraceae bacterium]|jgi:plastocyanin|nr:plastocyanin/azurin family copper-binding protein [Solirubrobacteraceae bacterium]